MVRKQRRFGELEKDVLLKVLKECRGAAITASDAALFDRKDVVKGCHDLQNAIDALAEMLTGNREYFWAVAHSSSRYLKSSE